MFVRVSINLHDIFCMKVIRRLFDTVRLLTFPTYRMGAYSRLGAQSNKYRTFYFVCFFIF